MQRSPFSARLVTGAASPAGGTVYQGNCRGADAATRTLLGVLGGSLTIPIEVTGTVPGTVAPDDGSSPVEFSWSLEVDGAAPEFAALWAVVGANSLTAQVSGINLPVLVSGSGTTATNVTGTPAGRSITIKRGESVSISEGPFSADVPITGNAGDQIVFTVGNPGLTLGLNRRQPGRRHRSGPDLRHQPEVRHHHHRGGRGADHRLDRRAGRQGWNAHRRRQRADHRGRQPADPRLVGDRRAAGRGDGLVERLRHPHLRRARCGHRGVDRVEVCGEEIELVPANPGTDEVQQVMVEEPYAGNRRPLFIGYVVNGSETEVVPYAESPFFPVLSDLKPPLAAEFQAQLETAPGVAPGDVVVTGGPDAADRLGTQSNPYTITYAGNLATTDVADLVVGEFSGWPPRAWLDAIIEFASGLGGGGDDGEGGETDGDEGTGDSAIDDFLANLDINAILESITSLFPDPPAISTLTQGEAPAEAQLSGPLCGAGTVSVTVGTGVPAAPTPNPNPTPTPAAEVQSATQTPAPAPAATAVTAQPTFTG